MRESVQITVDDFGVAAMHAQYKIWDWEEVREMLGRWVSGEEPIVVCEQYGNYCNPLGLTVEGRTDIIVEKRPPF